MLARKLTLKMSIVLLVIMVVLLSLVFVNIRVNRTVSDGVIESEKKTALQLARTIALHPVVIAGLAGRSPDEEIQKSITKIREHTHTDFIVVMDTNGIRKSHPDPNEIGKKFAGGDENQVLSGKEYVSVSEGTLGLSLRAFTPVFDQNGEQIGAVVVGILLNGINAEIKDVQKENTIGISYGLLIGIIGALLIAGYVKKTLFGLEPIEIAKKLQEREAMLDSVKEGILAADQEGKLTLLNKAGHDILQKAGIHGLQNGEELYSNQNEAVLSLALQGDHAEYNEEIRINNVELLVNKVPIVVDEKSMGFITTFNDKTDVTLLAEQLTGVKQYAETLRGQSHEFINRLHVILGLITLKEYDQLKTYIHEIVFQSKNEQIMITRNIKNPYLAGFFIGKLSNAREKDVSLRLTVENTVPETDNQDLTHDLVTTLGNLIGNAIEAVQYMERKEVEVTVSYEEGLLTVIVEDSGAGIKESDKRMLFDKGFSTKGEDRGYGLYFVKNSIEKHGGHLAFTSEENEGTCFVVEIPYKVRGWTDDKSTDR